MAITLNGTTGISSPGGDTSTSLATTNLSYTGTLTGGTGVIAIGTNQIYKDASGNLGIGIASPSAPLHIYSSANSSAPRLKIQNPNTGSSAATSALFINDSTAQYLESGVTGTGWNDYGTIKKQSGYCIAYGSASTYMTIAGQAGIIFGYGANPHTEAMRIDTSGNLLVGPTSAYVSGTGNALIQISASGTGGALALRNSAATAGKYWRIGPDNSANNMVVYNQNNTGVYMTDGGSAWIGSSDERLKTDLKPIENAAQKVSTLRAVTGRFKTDDESVSRSFLIAQDVQAVLPEAVDASDPDKLGVAYTDTIPLLVAAIKELTAKVTALEAK